MWNIGIAVLGKIWNTIRWTITCVLMLLILRHSTLPVGQPYYVLASQVRDYHFDYVGWEVAAIQKKLGQAFNSTHAYFSEEERVQFVRYYFDDLAAVRQIESQIEALYTDPAVIDPDNESQALRQERDIMRANLSSRQIIVESILEGQVAAVLIDEGFGIGGQLFPPLSMHFTQRTLILLASPRDEIKMEHAMTIEPIPVDEQEHIEQRVLEEEDLSALVVPIGGMALYPAMVIETTSLPYIVDTFSHEWFHHYLMFQPLGWDTEIFQNPEARIINETSASVFGREIGRKVLERYYPELAPQPAPPSITEAEQQHEEPPPPEPVFDYNKEMNETRVTVDELLADGKVAEAETYMEQRRQLFVQNGYRIRKLNQAWFAFYGGYQVEGISAGGEDPIGPAIQDIRDNSPSLYEWTITMQTITTRDQLLTVRDTIVTEP